MFRIAILAISMILCCSACTHGGGGGSGGFSAHSHCAPIFLERGEVRK